MVDLPDPDAPTRPTNCPGSILRFMPESTGTERPLYVKSTSLNSIPILPSPGWNRFGVRLPSSSCGLTLMMRLEAADAWARSGEKLNHIPAAWPP